MNKHMSFITAFRRFFAVEFASLTAQMEWNAHSFVLSIQFIQCNFIGYDQKPFCIMINDFTQWLPFQMNGNTWRYNTHIKRVLLDCSCVYFHQSQICQSCSCLQNCIICLDYGGFISKECSEYNSHLLCERKPFKSDVRIFNTFWLAFVHFAHFAYINRFILMSAIHSIRSNNFYNFSEKEYNTGNVFMTNFLCHVDNQIMLSRMKIPKNIFFKETYWLFCLGKWVKKSNFS